MLASISFAVEASSLIIFLMASNHATNLFSGRLIKSWRKSISHPRITFCSLRRASDSSLFLAYIVSRGIWLFSCSKQEHVSKARRGRDHIKQYCPSLLRPLSENWGHQCSHPLCLMGQCQYQQSNWGLWQMGLSNLNIWGGTRCWFIPNSFNGSQLLLCFIAVVRLLTVSNITLHSYRSRAPPKVSRRLINASSSSGKCVTAFTEVLLWRWRHSICRLEVILLCHDLSTAQLISLNRHLPNLNCWSLEVSVQEFTLDPDFSHSKLWS